MLYKVFDKIENIVNNKNNVPIEDFNDLLKEISALPFEFPRFKLEPLFDVVNEKIN